MWGVFMSGGLLILAIVFSLAKASSRSDKITDAHRTELLERKKVGKTSYDAQNKNQMKG
ncbi:hypothetical protein B0H99_104212 [Planomicrobium soli]|uniref:Uncharacterized protein n=1 Tax=Planomicrobium soli TaxID=1176648 RepID=A0A2P8H3H3_9BACL|nr:hypothetical protein [Planomicrobium soli]PSL40750.1 hypothetical protein B0H99_104212 [Planomicrobium soli]